MVNPTLLIAPSGKDSLDSTGNLAYAFLDCFAHSVMNRSIEILSAHKRAARVISRLCDPCRRVMAWTVTREFFPVLSLMAWTH
jgi:hypothetical protein